VGWGIAVSVHFLFIGPEVLSSVEVLVHPNVLILDGSSAMVNTLDSILTSHGYRVEAYDDGEACWQRLVAGINGRVSIPDLLLLDPNMPGLDGLRLLGRIRAEERLARMPVIVLTAETDVQIRKDALGAGANDYLSKPVELSELLDRVGGVLSGPTAGGTLALESDTASDCSDMLPQQARRAVAC
jgi:DNA-binding response OmpR family regulator